MSSNRIFIYGSLRKEFSSPVRSVLKDYAEFFDEAVFQGRLYMIDWYPGAVKSENPDDTVIGEVYKIINREFVLEILDHYEGCSAGIPQPHEFVRKKESVRLKNGKEITAWIYLYDLSTVGKKRIPSGDYVEYSVKK